MRILTFLKKALALLICVSAIFPSVPAFAEEESPPPEAQAEVPPTEAVEEESPSPETQAEVPPTEAVVEEAPPPEGPFKITFNLNGGTGTVPEEIHTNAAGILQTALPGDLAFSRKGYKFEGWHVKQDGSLYGMMPLQTHTIIDAQTKFSEDTEVFASWQADVSFLKVSDGEISTTLGITKASRLIDRSGDPVSDPSDFKGPIFKDLNHNNKLDIYEDWRRPVAERVEDLANKLAADPNGVKKMAGLALYSSHQMILDPYIGDLQQEFLTKDYLRHVLVMQVNNPLDAAKWNNNIQALVETVANGLDDYGIPANNSSDPRHGTESLSSSEYASYTGGISAWPSSLGIAATFNPDTMLKFGQIASAEYRLMGVATALSPQIDIATDPRWSRFNGTFGEDPKLAADMAAAYVRGFQSTYQISALTGTFALESGWGKYSVNAMIKHWPGGGAGEGGQDAHYAYGKYAVYPGGNFNAHLIPFVDGAFNAEKVGPTQKAAAVMPYYTISYLQVPGSEPNNSSAENRKLNMANAYSKYMITDLLRGAYKFSGVVCTDWNVIGPSENAESSMFGPTPGMIWGVDDHYPDSAGFTREDRRDRADMLLRAGVNQFGGLNTIEPIIDAYNQNKAEIKPFLVESTKALLTNIFAPGLFENPYVDVSEAETLLGSRAFVRAGYQAQLDSMTLLKNKDNILPLDAAKKVYVPGAATGRETAATIDGGTLALIKTYFSEVITDPARAGEADAVLVFGSSLISGGGSYNEDGTINYSPANISYDVYEAVNARDVSVAGAPITDASGNVTGRLNNSYKDKIADPYADIPGFFGSTPSSLPNFKEDLSLAKASGKPIVLSLTLKNPVVLSDVEPDVSAILADFESQKSAVLDTIVGRTKNGATGAVYAETAPKGLLPLQMPRDMETVEAQNEDVPRDMIPYTDSEGNVWDFGFGLTYGQTEPLAIPAAYNQPALTTPSNADGAKAISERIKINFDYDGDGKPEFIKIVKSGEAATNLVDPKPEKEGFILDGWNLGSDRYDFSAKATAEITLTANWIPQAE